MGWSDPPEVGQLRELEFDTLAALSMKEQPMSERGPYRRHGPKFKLQLCSDIRDGKLGRRKAQKTHRLSANLIQLWLNQCDNGELDHEEAAASTVAEYEAKIAVLEHKVGQLTMELDLVKKIARSRTVSANEPPLPISGPNHFPFEGGR
jgi:transposase